MQFGEAIILSACARIDGTQEVELNAVCPASDYPGEQAGAQCRGLSAGGMN